MALGFAWFSPILFGRAWMKLVGLTEEDTSSAAMPAIIGSLIVTVVVLSIFIDFAQANDFLPGALIGFLVWLGFVATNSGPNYMFSRRPLRLIEAGDHFVVLVVAGAILGVMNSGGAS